MTAYNGGKKRIAKDIHKRILEVERALGGRRLPYFEPFCGMCSVLIEFAKDNDGRKLIACDANQDIVLMWRALKRGWIPPTTCTESMYNKLKRATKHSAERGFIGSACSYAGSFFSGYRGKYDKTGFCKVGAKSILNCVPYISNVDYLPPASYESHSPRGMLVYCDPPYLNNKVPNSLFRFDHDKFWNMMRRWSKHNIVIISERVAPSDFVKIWSKNNNVVFLNKKLHRGVRSNQTESLFMWGGDRKRRAAS